MITATLSLKLVPDRRSEVKYGHHTTYTYAQYLTVCGVHGNILYAVSARVTFIVQNACRFIEHDLIFQLTRCSTGSSPLNGTVFSLRNSGLIKVD